MMPGLADLQPLVAGHWYDAVAAVLKVELERGTEQPTLVAARELAVAAKRVLDLDAEDFGIIAREFPDRGWTKELATACFPVQPRSVVRGALGSLVPLYRLMLEVLRLRALRHEPLQLVVTAHLIGEYLTLLAWESTLGHAGDPLKMAASTGERWGSDDPSCPHTSPLRASAKRSLHAASGSQAGYTAYLDRFHSRLGGALAVCAMNHATIAAGERPDIGTTCPEPCSWAVRGTMASRRDLDARVRLALIYQASPIVALRHHAPVGHFFGVPSTSEINSAWERTWARLTAPWPSAGNPLLETEVPDPGDHEPLPGMAALVSAVAGRPITVGTLIREVGTDLAAALNAMR